MTTNHSLQHSLSHTGLALPFQLRQIGGDHLKKIDEMAFAIRIVAMAVQTALGIDGTPFTLYPFGSLCRHNGTTTQSSYKQKDCCCFV